DGLRAGHHALHHRQHYRAADDPGHPAAPGPEGSGPGRPGEDHPVHQVPHRDARRHHLGRVRGAGPLGEPVLRHGLLGGEPSADADPSMLTIATMMITMVAGTAVIMWM